MFQGFCEFHGYLYRKYGFTFCMSVNLCEWTDGTFLAGDINIVSITVGYIIQNARRDLQVEVYRKRREVAEGAREVQRV